MERNSSLPDNLKREVFEECGLRIDVGVPCLVNEFHDPPDGFHQIEVFFRCHLRGSAALQEWDDPEGVVNHRRWVTRAEANALLLRPASLADVAWSTGTAVTYDALEPIIRV